MDALISRITAAGPSAKRPPHIWLEPELRAVTLLPLLGAALALVACDRQKADAPQQNATAETGAAAEAPTPDTGRVDVSHKGEAAPAVPFLRPDGGPATLTGFRGKPLLVNLWATWCAPCIKEMPTLDRLAQERADDFQLIVVSQDIGGKRAVDPFFAKSGFKALQPYLDKQNVLMTEMKLDTLPITIFYDARGREQWRVIGSMDWAGERAKKLIDDSLAGAGA